MKPEQLNIHFPRDPVEKEPEKDDGKILRDELEKKAERLEAALAIIEVAAAKLEVGDEENFNKIINEITKKERDKEISLAFLLNFVNACRKNKFNGNFDEESLIKIFSYLLMKRSGFFLSDSLLRYIEGRDGSIVERNRKRRGGGVSRNRPPYGNNEGPRAKRHRNAKEEPWGAGAGLPTGDID